MLGLSAPYRTPWQYALQLNKKLNYIKLGLFKIKKKIKKINYELDLLKKKKNLPSILYRNARTSI